MFDRFPSASGLKATLRKLGLVWYTRSLSIVPTTRSLSEKVTSAVFAEPDKPKSIGGQMVQWNSLVSLMPLTGQPLQWSRLFTCDRDRSPLYSIVFGTTYPSACWSRSPAGVEFLRSASITLRPDTRTIGGLSSEVGTPPTRDPRQREASGFSSLTTQRLRGSIRVPPSLVWANARGSDTRTQ